MSLTEDRGGVQLDHWGPPIDGDVEPWNEPDRHDQFRFPPDAAPLEYATAGQRHVGFSELHIDRGALGPTGARWRFDGARCGDRDLELMFSEMTTPMTLTLSYATAPDHDVVRRWAKIGNLGDETVTLPRAFSAAWSLPVGRTAKVEGYTGAWSREFGTVVTEVRAGAWSVQNRSGVTGLDSNPVVMVAPLDDSTDETASGTFGIALAWSGNWHMRAEAPPTGDRFRVSCGVDDDTTSVTLDPGEFFTTPEALGVWSASGPHGIAQAWHEYQRAALARDLDDTSRRPVVYNSWFATEFDVRATHQLDLADIAAEIGAELFVVDDGWFVGRESDRAGLGDWVVDRQKFPDGLDGFAAQLRERGLRFGLWIEPEAVSPTSELLHERPDWIYRVEGRPMLTARNQYVLDLGRDSVVEWIEETLRQLLRSAPIDYLKWDMNRPVSDGGRPGDRHGREWSVTHTRNYYRVLRMLRTEFPNVTLEGCAAGGGRIDDAVLALVDVVWPSDETSAADRLAINDGYLRGYPPYAMSTWVTDAEGQIDRSSHSFEYAFVVAMSGALGIGANIAEWTADQRRRARVMIDLYRELRSVLHGGRVRRHGDPRSAEYALEYRNDDDNGPIVMLVYDRERDRVFDREARRVRPEMLDDTRRYRLRGTDVIVNGRTARVLGVRVPFTLAHDADVLVFEPID